MIKFNEEHPDPSFFELVGQSAAVEPVQREKISRLQDLWQRLKKNKAAVICFILLAVLILFAIIGPYLSPYSPDAQNLDQANLPPRVQGFEQMPFWNGKQNVNGVTTNVYEENHIQAYYWFGTDELGRDIFSRTWMGTRISLIVALVATLVDLIFGVTYGLISGYFGGRIDTLMQRFLEIISGIPNLVVVILMLLVMKPGLGAIIIAIAFSGWINMARVIRAQVLKLRYQDYIVASVSIGETIPRILRRHLVPNLAGVIIINTMFAIPDAIFFEAFLSFIGIGLQPPTASLGTLIGDGYKTLRFLPYQLLYPSVVICLLMISFNIIADGLRDIFDPKMRD